MPRLKKKYQVPPLVIPTKLERATEWPRYMTYKVAARYTSSSYNTIRQLVLAGDLKVVEGLFGKANKVDRLEIDALFQKAAA